MIRAALYAATLTACFAALLTLTGPELDAMDQNKALQDAKKQAKQDNRFEKAARAICGRHGWQLFPDRSIQCGGGRLAQNAPR